MNCPSCGLEAGKSGCECTPFEKQSAEHTLKLQKDLDAALLQMSEYEKRIPELCAEYLLQIGERDEQIRVMGRGMEEWSIQNDMLRKDLLASNRLIVLLTKCVYYFNIEHDNIYCRVCKMGQGSTYFEKVQHNHDRSCEVGKAFASR